MTAPAPVILLAVLMVGYPLVQVLAILLRRRKRLHFNELSARMLAEPELDEHEKRVVRWLVSESRGALHTLTSPLTFSAIVFQSATRSRRIEPWTEDTGNHATDERDPRLRRLGELSMQLEMASYPITTALTAATAVVSWLFAALIMLLRGSLPARFSMRELVSASGHPTGAV